MKSHLAIRLKVLSFTVLAWAQVCCCMNSVAQVKNLSIELDLESKVFDQVKFSDLVEQEVFASRPESKSNKTTATFVKETSGFKYYKLRGPISRTGKSAHSLRVLIQQDPTGKDGFDDGQTKVILNAVRQVLQLDATTFVNSLLGKKLNDPRDRKKVASPPHIRQKDFFPADMEEGLALWIMIHSAMGVYDEQGLRPDDHRYRPLVIEHFSDSTIKNNTILAGTGIIDYYIEFGQLRIRLNGYFLNRNRKIGAQTFDFRSPDKWSGTILHECLHNLGWDHPSGYTNSWIVEAEKQVPKYLFSLKNCECDK